MPNKYHGHFHMLGLKQFKFISVLNYRIFILDKIKFGKKDNEIKA
jgi:hypothetical protein